MPILLDMSMHILPPPLVVKLCNTQENTRRTPPLVSCYITFTELLSGSCGTGIYVSFYRKHAWGLCYLQLVSAVKV